MRKRERDRQTEKEGEEAVGEIEHVQQSKVARSLSPNQKGMAPTCVVLHQSVV